VGVGDKETGERTDRATRVILASPRTLFRAFLDAEMLASWRVPEGMTARIERFDARIGGGYRIILSYLPANGKVYGKTVPGTDVCDVRFVEIAPDDSIVEEIRFISDDPERARPMTMTTRFEPVIDGTKVTITALGVPVGIAPDDHELGLASSLSNLARLTE
jgi:uncharacterized protein YndB with AHSA1/START domain